MTVQDTAVVYLCGVDIFCYSKQNDVNSLFTCYFAIFFKYILITIYPILCSLTDKTSQPILTSVNTSEIPGLLLKTKVRIFIRSHGPETRNFFFLFLEILQIYYSLAMEILPY